MLRDIKFKTVGTIFSLAFALVGLLSIVSIIVIDNKVTLVKHSWQTYQIDRSDKAKLTSILQAEIGFGGAIHHFKNYILRKDIKNFEQANNQLIEINATIRHFNSLALSETEAIALQNIRQTFSRYQQQLMYARTLFDQGRSSQEVDTLVIVDDQLALQGLQLLNNVQKSTNLDREKSKYHLIVNLRSILGYGGFIHHFKNALLRADINKLVQAKEKLNYALILIEEYQQHNLTANETDALLSVRTTLANYVEKIDIAHQLIEKNYTSNDIDNQVIVNDTPAIEGLLALNKEIYALTLRRSVEVNRVLKFLTSLVDIVTLLMIYITTSLILFSLWLVRYRLIQPISALITNMKRLAKNDFDISIKGSTKNNEIGEMARSIEIFRDNAQKRLAIETKIKTILQSALDGIITINAAGLITSFNPAAEKMFGYQNSFVMGKNVSLLMPEPHKSNHDRYLKNHCSGNSNRIIGDIIEQNALKKNGDIFPIEISLTQMEIADETYFTAIIRDITERVKREKEIKKMALSDSLTGIANRYQFEAKLKESSQMALRTKTSVALVLIDLDKFKPVNDNYGHQVGDKLLKEVADRLTQAQRETDVVARIGGDEFAIVLNHLNNSECVKTPIARYQKLLSEPYCIDGHNLDVGASFGFAIFPQDDTNLAELFRLADESMYQAKSKTKGAQKGR